MMKNLICINCPRGCRVNIEKNGDSWNVDGNFCPRGKTYAISEMTDPRRTLTAAVPSADPESRCASVRSSEPMPVKLIPEVLNELYKMRLSGNYRRGDVLLKNFQSCGVDIIFTADFPLPH